MSNMMLPEWVQKFKTKGISIQKRGDSYLAYRISSKWDPKKKRSQKITEEYLGVVTPNGIYKPRKMGFPKGDYDYGNVALLWQLAQKSGLTGFLQEYFPYEWKEILSFSILRLIQPLPLKSIHVLYEKTYLIRYFDDLSLSAKRLSTLLHKIGSNYKSRNKLMCKLTQEGKYILVDLTALLSYSTKISLLEKGTNKDHLFIPQMNLLLLFSSDFKLPTYARILPGSIKDVSTVKNIVELTGLKNFVLIGDRGFYSAGNVKILSREQISYLLPLKRNLKLIPKKLPSKFDAVFLYHERPIKGWKKSRYNKWIYTFEDNRMAKEEDQTFLKLIEQGKRTQDEYLKKRIHFGKIYFLSDVDSDLKTIYYLYKDRQQIEYAFNVFKNLLDGDKMHLQDDKKVEGYVFVNFLSLYLYYLLLNKLKEAELSKKYSVNDILLHFSKVKVYEFNETEVKSEVPKKVREAAKSMGVDFDLLLTSRRS